MQRIHTLNYYLQLILWKYMMIPLPTITLINISIITIITLSS